MSGIEIVEVDWALGKHAEAVVSLVDHYSRDPIGGGRPLPQAVREALAPGLRDHPTSLVFLAFLGAKPVGLAVCFRGFNTFSARPIVNVHDLIVTRPARGQGIGRALMQRVESVARRAGCTAVTLEVRGDNPVAQRLYRSLGFEGGVFDPPQAEYAFWRKDLTGPGKEEC